MNKATTQEIKGLGDFMRAGYYMHVNLLYTMYIVAYIYSSYVQIDHCSMLIHVHFVVCDMN